TMNGEHISMRRVPLVFSGDIESVVEDLDLNGAQKGHSRGSNGRTPNEHTGVSTAAKVTPFEFDYEILILARCAERSRGQTGAVDHTVLNTPSLRSAVYIYPAGEISPVEQWNKPILLRRQSAAAQEDYCKSQGRFHMPNVTGRWAVYHPGD